MRGGIDPGDTVLVPGVLGTQMYEVFLIRGWKPILPLWHWLMLAPSLE